MSTNSSTQWGSRIGFILAGAGSAIGLGAIWKFPFWAGTNGGAAFIIPYIFFTFTIGIVLLIAELAVGRSGRGSAMHALKVTGGPVFAVLGSFTVLSSYIILSYYSVVGGWCMKYLLDSVIGRLVTNDPKILSANFEALVTNGPVNLAWHFIFLSMTCGVIALGVVKGIERVAKYLMPTLFILMILIIIRSVTLPGAGIGLEFLFKLDLSSVTLENILNAMGFTFFSLSIGCGIMVTYGAYLPNNTDIPYSSLWISYLAIQASILAGLMIMPAVFALGQDPNAGPGLVFVTVPLVFSQIPFGAVAAVFFNICLVVAALTSAVSLLEVVVAYLQHEWGLTRGRATALCYVSLFFVGGLSALSFGAGSEYTIGGRILFDFLDYICTNVTMPVGGLAVAILAGWVAWNRTEKQINLVRTYPKALNRFICFSLRILAPALVVVVIATGI